jgi:hypothetical protein
LAEWPVAQRINGTDTTTGPLAAAVFLNQIYLFWHSSHSSSGWLRGLLFSMSSDGRSWPAGIQVDPGAAVGILEPPTACVFSNQNGQGQLYLFFVDQNNSINFSVCTDGQNWNGPAGFINNTDSSPFAPAGCVFQNQLFLIWVANDPSNRIFFSAYAGATDPYGNPIGAGGGGVSPWPAGQLINNTDSTPCAPVACVFQNQLYLFWSANDSSNRIFFSASSDGQAWPAGQTINNVDSAAPGVLSACVFQGQLYLFWKDNNSSALFFSASFDGQTWPAGAPADSTDQSGDYNVASLPPGSSIAACVLNNYISLFWQANDGTNGIIQSASQRPVLIGTS